MCVENIIGCRSEDARTNMEIADRRSMCYPPFRDCRRTHVFFIVAISIAKLLSRVYIFIMVVVIHIIINVCGVIIKLRAITQLQNCAITHVLIYSNKDRNWYAGSSFFFSVLVKIFTI